jgi:hypothetical protein
MGPLEHSSIHIVNERGWGAAPELRAGPEGSAPEPSTANVTMFRADEENQGSLQYATDQRLWFWGQVAPAGTPERRCVYVHRSITCCKVLALESVTALLRVANAPTFSAIHRRCMLVLLHASLQC